MLKVRDNLIATWTRTLLLLNLLAVLTLMAVCMVSLRDYPWAVVGEVLAHASLPMDGSTLLTPVFHRRALRPVWLFVAVLGSSGCVWWISAEDNSAWRWRSSAWSFR